MTKVYGVPAEHQRPSRAARAIMKAHDRANETLRVGGGRPVTGTPLVKAEAKARTMTAHLPSNIKGADWKRHPETRTRHSVETFNHGKNYKKGIKL